MVYKNYSGESDMVERNERVSCSVPVSHSVCLSSHIFYETLLDVSGALARFKVYEQEEEEATLNALPGEFLSTNV